MVSKDISQSNEGFSSSENAIYGEVISHMKQDGLDHTYSTSDTVIMYHNIDYVIPVKVNRKTINKVIIKECRYLFFCYLNLFAFFLMSIV